jgi:hypothetical protein
MQVEQARRAGGRGHLAEDATLVDRLVRVERGHERLGLERGLEVLGVKDVRVHAIPLHMCRQRVKVCQQASLCELEDLAELAAERRWRRAGHSGPEHLRAGAIIHSPAELGGGSVLSSGGGGSVLGHAPALPPAFLGRQAPLKSLFARHGNINRDGQGAA